MKKYQNFLSLNFLFLVVKFSIYLNRHVFVMYGCYCLIVVLWVKIPAENILKHFSYFSN